MTQINEQEILQKIAEQIEEKTKMVLDTGTIKNFLLEVQREQLKALVYQAFISITAAEPDTKPSAQE